MNIYLWAECICDFCLLNSCSNGGVTFLFGSVFMKPVDCNCASEKLKRKYVTVIFLRISNISSFCFLFIYFNYGGIVHSGR